jgi:CMP-N,N'-diacetyllegionaminic acid synthase
MIVSVKETRANPYYLLVEEDKDQYLQKVKEHNSVRRQDVPNVFEYNGAVYVINVNSLLKKGLSGLSKKKKLLMDEVSSHDLDEMLDWYIAEMILEKKITAIDK